MYTTLLFSPGGSYPADAGLLPAFNARLLGLQRVDAHWIVQGSDGRLTARASLWHRTVPTLPDERVGIIGHYAAADAAAGAAVLARACAELAATGCTCAIGPMDRDTWHSYRFVTAAGEAPPFFLEPTQPADWSRQWTAAGFEPLAGYHSMVCENLAELADDPRQIKAGQRMDAAGIRLRGLEPGHWEEELRRIYVVAATAFRANFLFTPLPEGEFLELYQPLRPRLEPALVFLAEDETGSPVGFGLSLPDAFDPRRETCIVKTVAVLPEPRYRGLGRLLLDRTHAAARTLGYRRAIHALMHDGNVSRNLSARFGSRLLRRYTLFSRRLA